MGKYAMKALGDFVSKYILGQKTLSCDSKLTGTGKCTIDIHGDTE